MMENGSHYSRREIKRRAMRYQKHKRPRRPDPSIARRVIAVLLLLLLISIAGYTCGTAFARIGIHYEVGEYPETDCQWATVNGWKVNFRGGPGKDYPILEQWSMGAGVEVMEVQDGWAKVMRYTHPYPMYVWAEYLDFVD